MGAAHWREFGFHSTLVTQMALLQILVAQMGAICSGQSMMIWLLLKEGLTEHSRKYRKIQLLIDHG